MVILAAILVALILVGVGIGLALYRLIPERWGGPLSWGRRLALRFGSVTAFVGVAATGCIATVLVMMPVGLLAKSLQDSIDVPTLKWTLAVVDPQSVFTKLNNYVTTLGDRSTTDLVCVVAGLILAFAYRRRWWIPIVAIVVTFAAQHEGQLLLSRLLGRDLPPVVNAGAFPSGGVSRMLVDDGVIIVLVILILGTVSRQWRAGLWIGLGTFSAIEGFTRAYLSLHWLTDILAGLVFGWLMFFTFATATAALETRTLLFSGERNPPHRSLDLEQPIAAVPTRDRR